MKKVLYLTIPLLLAACNFPLTRNITPTPNVTQAYQTVSAQIATMNAAGTQVTAIATVTPAVSQTAQPTVPGATQPFPTARPAPTIVPTAVCDRILPGNPIDITIPDDSSIPANASFTKTWRLVNGGECTWTTDYSIAWVAGESMTDQKSYHLEQSVAPGHTIDISLDMTAPSTVGSYQSYWMLQNADGMNFGIGPNGKSPIWVKINVQSAQTATNTPAATNTPVPGHAVVYSGIVALNPAQSLDITSGAVANGDNLDLSYASDVLKAVNGAGMSAALSAQPNYSSCSTQSFSSGQVALTGDSLYKYFCIKDDQNNIASIQLLAFTSGSAITVEVNTWSAN